MGKTDLFLDYLLGNFHPFMVLLISQSKTALNEVSKPLSNTVWYHIHNVTKMLLSKVMDMKKHLCIKSQKNDSVLC